MIAFNFIQFVREESCQRSSEHVVCHVIKHTQTLRISAVYISYYLADAYVNGIHDGTCDTSYLPGYSFRKRPISCSLRPFSLPVPYESAVSIKLIPLLVRKLKSSCSSWSIVSSYSHKIWLPHCHVTAKRCAESCSAQMMMKR